MNDNMCEKNLNTTGIYDYPHDEESYVITIRRKCSTSTNNLVISENNTEVKGVNNFVIPQKPAVSAPSESVPPVAYKAPAAPAPKASSAGRSVKAPLPGLIVSILVKKGDEVKAGMPVAILEAMKMENEIEADSDGVVAEINVVEGDSVSEGDSIITLG